MIEKQGERCSVIEKHGERERILCNVVLRREAILPISVILSHSMVYITSILYHIQYARTIYGMVYITSILYHIQYTTSILSTYKVFYTVYAAPIIYIV